MTRWRILHGLTLIGFAFLLISDAYGQEFYRGQRIRFVVGFSAGSGFGAYTRTIARHLGPGDLIKTEDGRKLFNAVTQAHGASVRPYVLPPNTPKDRVQLLRKGFGDTMKDPDFLAEAQKGNIDINPLNGEELEKSVLNVLQLESGLVTRLKQIFK